MDLFGNIRMLSLEQATVLPYLTYRLAIDGCRVIRVEHPIYGDPNRLVGEPFLDGEERMNSYFMAINAGKEAITLNLAEPRGKEILARLIRELKVDIFATNQLPRNYTKLGIDYETLRSVKEDLIWLGITGFGPDSNEVAYRSDPSSPWRTHGVDGRGRRHSAGGWNPAARHGNERACLRPYHEGAFRQSHDRQRKSSRHLHVRKYLPSWLTVPITMTCSFGKKISRRGNTHEFFAPVSVYPTSDGYVYIAVGNDKQFQAFSSLPEFSSLAKDSYRKNAGRIADVDKINKMISETTCKMNTNTLLGLMNSIGVAASKINTVTDVARDPLVCGKLIKARDEKSGFELTLAPPPVSGPFLEANHRTLTFPPRFGEHNEAVYGTELGMSANELAAMRADGVI